MKRLIQALALSAAIFTASPAVAAKLEELYVYPFIQYFTWSEFAGGARLLKETGPQFGAGAAVKLDLYGERLILRGKAELFGGDVDYDGTTQNDSLPVKTDVIYFGSKLESDVGWRFKLAQATIEPFAGMGYRWWLRDLQDSTARNGNNSVVKVSGYTEYWQSIYTRLGVNAGYAASDKLKVFAGGGWNFPLRNENRVDYSGFGEVTLRPGAKWSSFAEAGLRYKQIRASLFYEQFRFSQSRLVQVGFGEFLLQPKSESEIFGMSVGWYFR